MVWIVADLTLKCQLLSSPLPEKEAMERLRKYLEKEIKKGTKVAEIERRSKGKIKDSTIFDIISGKTKSITIEKLDALADGLGMNRVEFYKMVSGIEEEQWTPQSLVRAIQNMLHLKPAEIKKIKKMLKVE